MEVLRCSAALYGEKSHQIREKSVMEIMDDAESNCGEQAKKELMEVKKADHLLPNVKGVTETLQSNVQEPTGEPRTLEGSLNDSLYSVDTNGLKSGDLLNHKDILVEQIQCQEACLDFQNSHVDVNTLDSEPLCDNKEEDISFPASKWPEHDEPLALWVKWRGMWQAGIKCERADWPLATVKAKPTHERKSYIVIFFPHTRNYSWADTLLVCAIDEFPQPIAHQSHQIGVQLVEDLTVARRFIMKKLVIGMLNIINQLPVQVLAETARDVVMWREFAAEASRCMGYPDLGRLLLKLQNMILQRFIDANWLQHSSHLWVEKCQNSHSADSIEVLTEELVNSILWNEVNNLQDAVGEPALGSEWKTWKHEIMNCFTTTQSVSVVGELLEKISADHLSCPTPIITSPQVSRKRPKLEVRRAETHNSLTEDKSFQKDTVVEIDSSFFCGTHDVAADDTGFRSEDEILGQGAAQITSPGSTMDRWDEVVDTINAESVQNNDGQALDMNRVVDTKSSGSKIRSRQCIAFIEAKGRQCVRWANDGDEYCCVHLTSRFAAKPVKTEAILPSEAPMCQGMTTTGSRCKHRSLLGSSFCKKHRPRNDGVMSPGSSGSHLKRKHDELSDMSELTSCKDIVLFEKPQMPPEEHSMTLALIEGCNINGGGGSNNKPASFAAGSTSKDKEIAYCIGLGLQENGANCLDSPKRHSLYCEKHVPSWLKRARNGKSRIISKEVYVDLLRACSSQKQKLQLHQACELFYKLFKSILSLRNPVPKEIQFQWALSEASKDFHVAELLMKLVSREKERLLRMWGFDLSKDEEVSSSRVAEQSLVPIEEETNNDGSFKCTICSEEFSDDQTLGAHWIDSHNKEAQWLFRGYACAICLDSFTNKKVLETHVQERHHAQFVEHCMLIQCIPCGSHFGNSEELWSHVLSTHTERFRQSKTGENWQAPSQQKDVPLKPLSIEYNAGGHSNDRKYICRFCGLKFDLLPDLGRHHQAAHMGPSSLSSRPKKKGLRFYTYRLKSGRLSRPRLKKAHGGASYRLRNKGSIGLKQRLQSVTSLGTGGMKMQSHVLGAASPVRLTEAQCSAIAKMLCSEAQKTKARPSNHEILYTARSVCCKDGFQRSLEHRYGALPERLYLKAAKLCNEHNFQVNWHQEGFNCFRGCKPMEDQHLWAVSTGSTNDYRKLDLPPSNSPLGEYEMDECHYVVDSWHYRRKPLQTTIILCDDISLGKEKVPIPCVVDKHLIDSLHYPTYGFDGKVIFMPWESFTYATKSQLHRSLDVNLQNRQLGCECSQSACSPEACDHVYLFNCDYENAKDLNGKLMEGRFPYDDKGRLILEDDYLVYECNQMCKCSKTCPNKVLQNGVSVNLEVFKTERKGWAVRTRETIMRGTFVCEFVGEVLDMHEAKRRRNRYEKEGCEYIFDAGSHVQSRNASLEGQATYVIDATRHANVSRFINHSCSPNLVSRLVLVDSMDIQLGHIGLYANQDIAAGEELSFDYHYELRTGVECPCLCGASTCRGRLH